MAWSDEARAAALAMRRRRAAGKPWRFPERARLVKLRNAALEAHLAEQRHPQRHTGWGRDYAATVTKSINAKRDLLLFKDRMFKAKPKAQLPTFAQERARLQAGRTPEQNQRKS